MSPDLEKQRARLAAERTLLAWVRTGLAMMGFGFVVARFGLFLHEMVELERAPAPRSGWSLYFGVALVLLGVGTTIAAAIGHMGLLDRLDRGEVSLARRWSQSVVVSFILGAVGVAMAVYLLWVAP
jgi:putative membrane protein